MLQRSEEWFKARIGRFTASDIFKIMGVNVLYFVGVREPWFWQVAGIKKTNRNIKTIGQCFS